MSCRRLTGSSLLLALAALVACGCSGERFTSVPVSGRVTIGGQAPPKECYVFFALTKVAEGTPNRPSMTTVKPDGTYAVKSFRDSQGLIPGTYNVMVAYTVLKPGGNPNSDASWVERRYEAGEFVVDGKSGAIEHNIEVPAGATKGKS
jgi:hypothetical protein